MNSQAASEEIYSPYCTICTGCGEDGCCSALCCQQHPDGKYCASYLKDLQFGYIMYQKLYNLISKDEKYTKIVDELWDNTWNVIYKHGEPDFIKWSTDAGFYVAYSKENELIFWNKNDIGEDFEKCYTIHDIFNVYEDNRKKINNKI